ncbi:ABC transporter substrate-binding protein [Pigmentiphaga soli]|uniref:ABC transporter substrate-binding protein n=1 Tax=Pigmentiphaga soli TaxID=1007095 RepID=A0ABP8HCA5_9BURK
MFKAAFPVFDTIGARLARPALRACGALAAAAAFALPMGAHAQDKVRVRMDWTTLGYHAPFYYGVAKGIYARHGLDVQVDEGKGSASVAQLAAAGSDDFGFADATTVAQLAGRGLPAKVVMGVLRATTVALFYADGRGIKTPADMRGRSVSLCPSDAISVYQPAYFKSLGIAPGDVKNLSVDCSIKYAVVAQGKADAVMTYATAGKPLLQKVGIANPGLFRAGPDFYLPSHGIVAADSLIKAKPDLIRRFVAATAQAWTEAMKDPDGAVAATVAARPLLKGQEQTLKDTFVAALDYVDTPATKGKPFGWQSPDDWQKALGILREYAGLNKDLKPEAVYTNDFIAAP